MKHSKSKTEYKSLSTMIKKGTYTGILILSVLMMMGTVKSFQNQKHTPFPVADILFCFTDFDLLSLHHDCIDPHILASAPIAEEVGFMRPVRKSQLNSKRPQGEWIVNPSDWNKQSYTENISAHFMRDSVILDFRHVVNAGKSVSLESGSSIALKPGFHAQTGSSFYARVLTR